MSKDISNENKTGKEAKMLETSESLRRSQQMFTNVLANFPGVVFWKDIDSVYIGCNKNFSNAAGLAESSSIAGKTDYDLPWGQTEADAYRADDRQVMQSGIAKLNIVETQLQSDGNIIWFDTSKIPLFDAAGAVIGVLGISNDITARKKAEGRLHKDKIRAEVLLELYEKSDFLKEEQLYRYVQDQVVELTDSTIGFFHLVSDDQKNVILTTWNDEALKNSTAAYNTDYLGEAADSWVDTIRAKQPIVCNDYDNSPHCKGLPVGHTLVRRLMSIPVMEGDKVRFIFGVGNKSEAYDDNDIMHIQLVANQLLHIINRRNAENLLRDAQEELVRKEKLAILGRLSGCVGHELRNPLGVMSNAVYFLKMVLPDADETTKEYLGIIEQEIDNSLRIITDLLDFARTKPPRTGTIMACELINIALKKCDIPENVSIQTDIAETLPLLWIDPLQIEQVLVNLITNGIQAMPDGGSLRVGAALCGCPPDADGAEERTHMGAPLRDFIKISVGDSGYGITPENMKKLFRPLFTTKAKGIGLGLVVCKNLVEANGGSIEVESRVGEGTTFSIRLPLELS